MTISLQNIHNVILKESSTQFKRISEGDTKLRIDYCGFGPFCSTRTKLLLSFFTFEGIHMYYILIKRQIIRLCNGISKSKMGKSMLLKINPKK